MPPYDPNLGRDPERDPFNLFGRRLAGLGDWLFTPSERSGLGGATPYGPNIGESVDPMEAGQKKALGVDMTQPTFPPRTPVAPTVSRPQGGSSQTPNTPTPRDPMFRDVESGASSTATPLEIGQKKALGGDSHIRFKMGGGDWQDYDRGTMEQMGRGGYIDSAVGSNASPEDWRARVANPEAFSGYQESLNRVAEDAALAKERMLAKDPMAVERAATDRQLGLYRGMKDIDRAEMNRRSQAFMQAMKSAEEEYRGVVAALQQRYSGKALQDKLDAAASEFDNATGQIKSAHGFGDKSRNDAFEGIGRRG